MKKTVILVMSILLTSMGAFAQTTKADKKALKKEAQEREFLKSKEIVNSGSYTFVALQASILGGDRFFMNTIPNYIHIDNTEADIYMPYFGTVHMSNGYKPEAVVKYKGKIDNYELKIDDKKKSIVLNFEIMNGNELIEFNFDIYKGGATTLVLASNRRKAITYFGEIQEIEKPLTN